MVLSLCVVGCGEFARTFARAMQSIPDQVQLLFASRDSQRAADYSAQFNGIGHFGSYQAAAADPRVDAMYICTPHYLHLEHGSMATAAGKHLLVEKPLARSRDEAYELIRAAERAGVTLMVAENYRFMSGVRLAKNLIDSGSIGDVRLVQLQEEAEFRPAYWRNDHDLNGGGTFMDGGIHKVDLFRYLAGEPTTVYASRVPSVQHGINAEDGLAMIARTANGVTGIINHSWARTARPQPMWLSVTGSAGRIYYQLGSSELLFDDGRGEQKLPLEPDYYGLKPMALEFHASIAEGRPPETSGAEGLADVITVLKAYESMETGQAVTVI